MALVHALSTKDDHASVREWFEAIVSSVSEVPISDVDVATLEARFHEASGATALGGDDEQSAAQRYLWSSLAAGHPTNKTLALLALDVDYHHANLGDDEALERFIGIVASQPVLLYKTGLYAELYDHARAAGAASWARFRILDVMAQAASIEGSNDLLETCHEVLEELSRFSQE